MAYSILITEDEDKLKNNLTFILNSEGYNVYAARNIQESRDILSRRQIDILITDLVLPDGSGESLVENVCEEYPHIQTIIMTAYPSTQSAIAAVKKGVVEYFTKPFKIEDLLNALKRAIKRKEGRAYKWEALKPYSLTQKEKELACFLVESGKSEAAEIAEALKISIGTAKKHLNHIYEKFSVNNKASLISTIINIIRQ